MWNTNVIKNKDLLMETLMYYMQLVDSICQKCPKSNIISYGPCDDCSFKDAADTSKHLLKIIRYISNKRDKVKTKYTDAIKIRETFERMTDQDSTVYSDIIIKLTDSPDHPWIE